MPILSTQSTIIKDYAELDGLVFIFSASGVDIFRKSYTEWVKLGFAALSNVTTGTVNENGIWLGTSDRGVFQCPIGNGDLSNQLLQYYTVTDTTYTIQSDSINHLAGVGTKLLICHSLGAEFLPAPGNPFQYSDEATNNAAINDTFIAYSVATGVETIEHPTADWVSGDTTALTTISSPALSSSIVNHLEYGDGDNLFIAGGAGVDIFLQGGEVIGPELFVSPTLDSGWTDNGGGSYTYAGPDTSSFLTITTPLTVGKFYTATMTGTGLTGAIFGWSVSGFGSEEQGRTSDVDGTITAPSMEATGTSLRAFLTGSAVTLTGLSVKEVSASTITTIASGSIAFVWADSRATQV